MYKIDNSRTQQFYNELSSKMNLAKTITAKELNWNWLLQLFDEPDIQLPSSPSAVLLVEKGEDHIYVITFGHSFFLIDKFDEKDFRFTFARKILFGKCRCPHMPIGLFSSSDNDRHEIR